MTPLLIALTSNLDKMGGHADALLAVAGVLGLLGAAWRWSVKLSKKFDIINDLVAHELNHNSGSSVKDKAYKSAEESTKAADAAERAVQGVNDLKGLLDGYVTASANEHKAIWNAIGVIQKAQQ
jgi:hypothetical protein